MTGNPSVLSLLGQWGPGQQTAVSLWLWLVLAIAVGIGLGGSIVVVVARLMFPPRPPARYQLDPERPPYGAGRR